MNKYLKMKNNLLGLNNLPIYIAGHLKPDQDSIGSSLALALWLNLNGKKANVLLKQGDESILDWYGGSELIVNNIKDDKYNFIALDVNEMKRLGVFYDDFLNANYTINIDHHQGNLYEAKETLSVPGISSTCEIIYEIIKPGKSEKLDLKICELLYAGMMNDTNCFSRRLSENTMKIAQKLINTKIDYSGIIKKTFSNRSLYQMKAFAKVVAELKYDKFHYSIIDKSYNEFKNLSHNQIVKQIAEDLRKIDGIDLLIVLIKDNDTIVAKVMTNMSDNADKIAILFGGGGHKREAGFTIKNISIEEIIDKTKQYLNK